MKKSTSRSRRYLITKNSILLLVMLVVIFMAVWAWFVADNSSADASGLKIAAADPGNVELALPEKVVVNDKSVDSFPINNSSWSSTIQFENTGYIKDFVKDVTSDGKDFIIPGFEASTNLKAGRKVNIDDAWIYALSSKEALNDDYVNNDDQYNYLSLDFYARAKVRIFNILGGSFLAAGSELGITDNGSSGSVKSLIGANPYRPSTYGPATSDSNAFSADAIVGAMRVSIVGAPVDGVSTDNNTNVTTETTYNGQSEWANAAQRKFVWLPRPDLFLYTDSNQTNWRLIKGIKPSCNTSRSNPNLTSDEINNIAKQTYCHSFYKGKIPEGTNVKKGVEKVSYCDANVLQVTGANDSQTDFAISKTNSDNALGDNGHYPILGQNKQIASGAPESSKNITFNAENGDTRTTSGYYIYKFNLNIWIEGEDAEARRSMSTGVFSLNIKLGASEE